MSRSVTLLCELIFLLGSVVIKLQLAFELWDGIKACGFHFFHSGVMLKLVSIRRVCEACRRLYNILY